jgi:hypothetical protein
MQKRLFLLFLFISLCGNILLQATEVPTSRAEKVALTYIQQRANFSGTVSSISTVSFNGTKCYYVINFAPQGWALISADDVVTPVLGYSTEGHFIQSGMPDNISGWLNGYSKEIKRCIDLKDGTHHPGWDLSKAVTRANDPVDPIIKVHWNQGSPYNKYCPVYNGKSTYVGCVAVSMAQAMSVFKYPSRPIGNHADTDDTSLYIDYDKEPAYDWTAILNGSNSYDNVARLLYQCGVSVNMQYTSEGSGAMQSAAAYALKTYFQYPSSVTFYWRSSYSSDNDWKNMIIGELENGRPVIYCGNPPSGEAGHSFDLDGYDGDSQFHVNWGWGGANEGYYTLDGLKVGSSSDYDFTAGQGAVVGIHTLSDAPTDISLSNASIKVNQPAGTKVGKVTVETNAKNPVFTYALSGPYSPITHTNITVPFTIKNDTLVTTEVITKAAQYKLNITVTNTNNNTSYTKNSISVYVLSSSGDDSPAKGVSLVYDKATKKLTIKSTIAVNFILSKSTGEVIDDGDISANGSVEADLTKVTAKFCILELARDGQTKDIKLILNK